MITLIAKTKASKEFLQRARKAFDEDFQIVYVRERVFFSDVIGPWYLIKLPSDKDWNFVRWVHSISDADFKVEFLFPETTQGN